MIVAHTRYFMKTSYFKNLLITILSLIFFVIVPFLSDEPLVLSSSAFFILYFVVNFSLMGLIVYYFHKIIVSKVKNEVSPLEKTALIVLQLTVSFAITWEIMEGIDSSNAILSAAVFVLVIIIQVLLGWYKL